MVLVGRLGAYLYASKMFGQPPGFWRVKGSVLSYMRERRVPLFLRNLADNKFARHRRSFSREQHRQSSSTILTKPNDDWTPHGKKLSGATTLRFLSAWTAYLRPAIDMAKACRNAKIVRRHLHQPVIRVIARNNARRETICEARLISSVTRDVFFSALSFRGTVYTPLPGAQQTWASVIEFVFKVTSYDELFWKWCLCEPPSLPFVASGNAASKKKKENNAR